jgi:hypothetical protein
MCGCAGSIGFAPTRIRQATVIVDDDDADFVANGWERLTDLPATAFRASYRRTPPTE